MSDVPETPTGMAIDSLSKRYLGRIKALENRIKKLEAALRIADVELAALFPEPNNPKPQDGQFGNPADAECVIKALLTVHEALDQEEQR